MTDIGFSKVTEANFETDVIAHDGLVVLDFWNDGCLPCKQLSKVLAELAPGLPPSVRIATVNASENAGLAARFNVRSVPTLVFLKGGAVVDTRTGVDRRQVIKKLVETHA